MRKTVVPVAQPRGPRPTCGPALCGSRPVVGSSRKSDPGRWTMPERDVEPAAHARRSRCSVGRSAALVEVERARGASRPAASAAAATGRTAGPAGRARRGRSSCGSGRRPGRRSRSAGGPPPASRAQVDAGDGASPPAGASSVASIRRVVVLPAPFGPRKPKISPASTCEVDAGDGLDLGLLAERRRRPLVSIIGSGSGWVSSC